MTGAYIPKYGKKKRNRESIVEADRIFKAVEKFFLIDRETITSKSRVANVLYPRQVCIWLLWKYSIHSPRGIGVFFDQKHDSSVVNAVKSINDYIDTDEYVRKQIEELEVKLKNESKI